MNTLRTHSLDVARKSHDNRNHSSISPSANGLYKSYCSSDVLKTFQDELTAINSKIHTKNKEFALRKSMIK